jgi:NAD+ synthase
MNEPSNERTGMPQTLRSDTIPAAIPQLTAADLLIDTGKEIDRLCAFIANTLAGDLKRRGVIIALSGGIDSSVTAALCARAIGAQRVIGLLMPERHSAAETSQLGRLCAESLGISALEHDITPVLESTGCYVRQNAAIRSVVPEFTAGDPFKIAIQLTNNTYRMFMLVVQLSDGTIRNKRLPHSSYLQIVAATNFKQRIRKMIEYYYADRHNYAVAGSPNRLEFDQGFFVKGGDGAADIKPLAHLYKTQVYALAQHLGIPEEIRRRPPTTDTYPMEQSQEEFYFSVPYTAMDLCLLAYNRGLPPESVCTSTGLTPKQALQVFEDIRAKRRTTRYLHLKPLIVEEIPGVG